MDASIAWSRHGKGPRPKPVKRPWDLAADRERDDRKRRAAASNERIAKAMHRALQNRKVD